jgi:hypothetical protein
VRSREPCLQPNYSPLDCCDVRPDDKLRLQSRGNAMGAIEAIVLVAAATLIVLLGIAVLARA